MVGQKGVFFTFMAFLLVGTLIVLTSSVEQAESDQETNLAEEAALNEVKNVYNNIEQQVSGLGQIHAVKRTPFTNFETDTDWFLFEGQIPLQNIASDDDLVDAIDALSLLKVFAEKEASEGMQVKVDAITQSSGWETGSWSGGTADINYLLLDPCLRISGRSIIENNVEKTSLRIEEVNEPACTSLYNCAGTTDIDIDVIWDPSNPIANSIIDGLGCLVVTENEDAGECYKTVELKNTGTILYIELGRLVGSAACPSRNASYSALMQFGSALGNFDLENISSEEFGFDLFGDFNYYVKKPEFGFCAGTGENVCIAE
jgi:hypothetical protein